MDSGNAINLPLDVATLANSLPRMPSDIDVNIIEKEGAPAVIFMSEELHALQWLVANNKYYILQSEAKKRAKDDRMRP